MRSALNIAARPERMTATDWAIDAIVAAGAFCFGCLQLSLAVNLLVPDAAVRHLLGIEAVVPTPFAVLSVLLISLPLVVRRRFPWLAFAVSLAFWLVFQMSMTSVSLSLVAPLAALFTIGLARSRNETMLAALLIVSLLLVMPQIGVSSTLSSISLIQNLALTAAVGFAGYALHVRQDYLRAAEDRVLQAERTRESEAQRRVEEERVRIAREVHDITAHSLSAVSIQAAAAERLVDRDPQAAKEAIALVRTTAKTSLEELRAMVGVLRAGDDPAETAPVEGTDRMCDLVAYLQSAGVDCSYDDSGYRRSAVSTLIDVALFGIAREACTNIVRHAGATRALLVLATRQDAHGEPVAATLTVTDNGRGANVVRDVAQDAAQEAARGHGLVGMRERTRLLKGSFDAHNVPSGGFAVRVDIPLSPRAERSEL